MDSCVDTARGKGITQTSALGQKQVHWDCKGWECHGKVFWSMRKQSSGSRSNFELHACFLIEFIYGKATLEIAVT